MPLRLFVGKLPFTVSNKDSGDFVANAGFKVYSAIIITDKQTGYSRGFGFVELAEGEDPGRAIAQLNGQNLEGRYLTVSEARPKEAGSNRRKSKIGKVFQSK